jgi:hypothetical protein
MMAGYVPARHHPKPVHLARAPLENHHNDAKRTTKAVYHKATKLD